ncbi:tetratricopeptide repeat protein [Niabella beijingensis]|uniref:tetratricopeptide repeat protein n=1 Tax=Niabella beijingensis TaxID=2872700 RepID=UPI001CBC5289|nr:tetratricopeptide repeat protein [Niabella beijingensis]MBZ4191678.1 tetratricopeptide repeat protein [Niabella beijingensis]
MKKWFLLTAALWIGSGVNGQDTARIKTLMMEGVQLHERGQYADAIKKYEEVLAADPTNIVAQYEKTYSLMASKKYKEAIELSQAIIENKDAEPAMIGNAYSTWGSAVDEEGDHKKALKIYDAGIKKVPAYNMLNYNKAITYFRMNEAGKGVDELKQSLLKNPRHPASHFLLGRIMYHRRNKMAGMMPLLVYLLYDNKSKRAEEALTTVRSIVEAGVKQQDSAHYSIDIAPGALVKRSNKSAAADDDFSSMELFLGLNAAAAVSKTKEMLPADRFAYLLKQVIGNLAEQKGHTGFYGTFYMPFFTRLHQEALTESFAHHIFFPTGNVMNEVWVQDHQEQMKELQAWAMNYKWPVAAAAGKE